MQIRFTISTFKILKGLKFINSWMWEGCKYCPKSIKKTPFILFSVICHTKLKKSCNLEMGGMLHPPCRSWVYRKSWRLPYMCVPVSPACLISSINPLNRIRNWTPMHVIFFFFHVMSCLEMFIFKFSVTITINYVQDHKSNFVYNV